MPKVPTKEELRVLRLKYRQMMRRGIRPNGSPEMRDLMVYLRAHQAWTKGCNQQPTESALQ